MTHDYKRHGTTTLFAALNVLDETVIGRNMQRGSIAFRKRMNTGWRWERFVFHFTTRGLLCQAVQAPLETRRLPLRLDLQAAINRFLTETNAEPKPFTWTADPDKSSPPSDEGTKR